MAGGTLKLLTSVVEESQVRAGQRIGFGEEAQLPPTHFIGKDSREAMSETKPEIDKATPRPDEDQEFFWLDGEPVQVMGKYIYSLESEGSRLTAACRAVLKPIIETDAYDQLKTQNEKLREALRELLAEADVSNALWQQSRGFVGTVDDLYRQNLVPLAHVRARAVLEEVEPYGNQTNT